MFDIIKEKLSFNKIYFITKYIFVLIRVKVVI